MLKKAFALPAWSSSSAVWLHAPALLNYGTVDGETQVPVAEHVCGCLNPSLFYFNKIVARVGNLSWLPQALPGFRYNKFNSTIQRERMSLTRRTM